MNPPERKRTGGGETSNGKGTTFSLKTMRSCSRFLVSAMAAGFGVEALEVNFLLFSAGNVVGHIGARTCTTFILLLNFN